MLTNVFYRVVTLASLAEYIYWPISSFHQKFKMAEIKKEMEFLKKEISEVKQMLGVINLNLIETLHKDKKRFKCTLCSPNKKPNYSGYKVGLRLKAFI